MLEFTVPGKGRLVLKFLVFDFNGTIACDGNIIPGIREKINKLSERLTIYILTADTFGTVREECKGMNVEFRTLTKDIGGPEKEKFICELGPENTIAIGNGTNDTLMIKKAEIGIAVIGNEGAAAKTIFSADIVVNNINDALDLLLKPKRLKATLRK